MYPFRAFSGADVLEIQVRTLLNDFSDFCHDSAPGVIFSLHVSNELSRLENEIIHISPGQNVKILIKPKSLTTSRALRSYKPYERGCYFRAERKLRFFRSYSEQNCEVECTANITMEKCHCARFWMPSMNFSSTVPVEHCLHVTNLI